MILSIYLCLLPCKPVIQPFNQRASQSPYQLASQPATSPHFSSLLVCLIASVTPLPDFLTKLNYLDAIRPSIDLLTYNSFVRSTNQLFLNFNSFVYTSSPSWVARQAVRRTVRTAHHQHLLPLVLVPHNLLQHRSYQYLLWTQKPLRLLSCVTRIATIALERLQKVQAHRRSSWWI